MPSRITSLRDVSPGAAFRVTICDDGSTDTTWEMLRAWQGYDLPFDLKVLRNAVAIGCPATRNRLFAESSGEFCFVCDCDLEFTQEDWLDTLLASATHPCAPHLQRGFIAPMLITPDGDIQSAGGETNSVGLPCVHRFYGERCDLDAANAPCEVFYSPAAALLFRRSILDTIGGFWEQYRPTTFDDVDWLMKARSHGFKVWYEPAVKIVHREGSFRFKTDANTYFLHNRSRFLSQWPTLPK